MNARYSMNDLNVIIGRGSFGFVALIDGDPKIAAKHLAKDVSMKDSFLKEYNALKKLQHLNIVEYHGFEDDGLFNVIMMEYCERNSLYEVLNDPTIIYSWKTVLNWAEHLFSALCYLHKKEVVHRDIKPKNVLVKKDFILKLADFGCVRDLNTSTTASLAGTYRYMSPEAYGYPERRLITPLNDLYSVGLVLWEIIERRSAFARYEHYEHFNYLALFHDLWHGDYELEPIDCLNEALRDLVSSCAKARPDQRADLYECYELIKKLLEFSTEETFHPKIDETETNLIRPNSEPVDVSLLPERVTLTSSTKSSTSTTKFDFHQIETQTLIGEPGTFFDRLKRKTELEETKPIQSYALYAFAVFFLSIIIISIFFYCSNFGGKIATSTMERSNSTKPNHQDFADIYIMDSNSTKLLNKEHQNMPNEKLIKEVLAPHVMFFAKLCGKSLINTINEICEGLVKPIDDEMKLKCCKTKCYLKDIKKFCSN